MIQVLFVCLGNICRSPTADAVMRAKVKAAGLEHLIQVDSAGTANWHEGKQPDARSIEKAALRGYDLTPLRARQVQVEDFDAFDYVLAMDESNLADLNALKPAAARTAPQLFLREFGSTSEHQVPDPYYGGDDGFEHVLDLLEAACSQLLNHIQRTLNAS